MQTTAKQVIVLYQSASEKLNNRALDALSKLEERGAKVRIALYCEILDKYFHFPAIDVGAEDPETSFKHSGIDSILRYVEYEKCDFSQPRFFCGGYNFRGVPAIINFVTKHGNREEWRQKAS